MKFIKVINTFVVLALANVVRSQNKCSSKITDKGYKCCSSDCVITYTDEDGHWGFENDQWCGCEKSDNHINLSQCSSNITKKGYPCCPRDCKVVLTDDDGTWGLNNNNEWCGCNPENKKPTLQDMIDEYNNRAEEVLKDDKEIEKKWLIDKEKIPYDFSAVVGVKARIKQTYICFDPEIRVREYTTDKVGSKKSHEMTIKTNLTEDGLTRDETNIKINQEQYDNMMKKQEGNTIYKTRYQFLADGEILAIDIFEEDLEGLAYLEIEFATKEESDAFKTPDWVIKDVTNDIRYKNGYLSRYGIPDPQ